MSTAESSKEGNLSPKKDDSTKQESKEYIPLKSSMASKEEISKKEDDIDISNLENSLNATYEGWTLEDAWLGTMIEDQRAHQEAKSLVSSMTFPKDILELLTFANSQWYTIGDGARWSLFSIRKKENWVISGVHVSTFGVERVNEIPTQLSLPSLLTLQYDLLKEFNLFNDSILKELDNDIFDKNPRLLFTAFWAEPTHQKLFDFIFDNRITTEWNSKVNIISDKDLIKFKTILVKYIENAFPWRLESLCVKDPSTMSVSIEINDSKKTFVIAPNFTTDGSRIPISFVNRRTLLKD